MRELRPPTRREIPSINKISKEEDFPAWREHFLYTMAQFGLTKYVDSDVSEPDNPAAHATWQEDRTAVDNYIRNHIGDNKILRRLEDMGWTPRVVDPKSTYDFLAKYFEGTSSDSFALLNREFANIDRSKFASMEAFQSRVGHLRTRLNTPSSPWAALTDTAYVWMALKGIENYYPDLYNRMVVSVENKTLTWNGLMEEFQKITVAEKGQPALSQIKVDNNKRGNKPKDPDNNNKVDNKDNTKSGGDKRNRCVTCHQGISKGWKHCDACGHHRPPISTTCWWCHPESAPDSWVNKAVAIQKNNERSMTSTTGPFHQQSGVQNPATTPASTPSTKRVMFQTNMANLPVSEEMTSFCKGPCRH